MGHWLLWFFLLGVSNKSIAVCFLEIDNSQPSERSLGAYMY